MYGVLSYTSTYSRIGHWQIEKKNLYASQGQPLLLSECHSFFQQIRTESMIINTDLCPSMNSRKRILKQYNNPLFYLVRTALKDIHLWDVEKQSNRWVSNTKNKHQQTQENDRKLVLIKQISLFQKKRHPSSQDTTYEKQSMLVVAGVILGWTTVLCL